MATLIEVGFMINPDEYAHLITKETQAQAAEAIARGVVQYSSKSPKTSPGNIPGNMPVTYNESHCN